VVVKGAKVAFWLATLEQMGYVRGGRVWGTTNTVVGESSTEKKG